MSKRIARPSMLLVLVAVMSLAVSSTAGPGKGGGKVLPPDATPHGFSLDDMARALALFGTSGNDPLHYPNTPFQILFVDFSTVTGTEVACENGGSGFLQSGVFHFTVPSGTPFFVPLFTVDDSSPILGTFPADASAAVSYFFDPTQIGGRDFEVFVDGKSAPVGPKYLAGPVQTPPLLDCSPSGVAPPCGTHIIQLGVFLTRMSVGSHTVEIRGQVAGDLVLSTIGISCLKEDFTYVIQVVPRRQVCDDDDDHDDR